MAPGGMGKRDGIFNDIIIAVAIYWCMRESGRTIPPDLPQGYGMGG